MKQLDVKTHPLPNRNDYQMTARVQWQQSSQTGTVPTRGQQKFAVGISWLPSNEQVQPFVHHQVRWEKTDHPHLDEIRQQIHLFCKWWALQWHLSTDLTTNSKHDRHNWRDGSTFHRHLNSAVQSWCWWLTEFTHWSACWFFSHVQVMWVEGYTYPNWCYNLLTNSVDRRLLVVDTGDAPTCDVKSSCSDFYQHTGCYVWKHQQLQCLSHWHSWGQFL